MGLASVLLVLSPFTQINTPYPSTAYLKGYLEAKGVHAGQTDLGIETILALFSTQGLGELFAEIERRKGKYPAKVRGMLANKQRYIDTIAAVVAFLQGKNDPLAYRICNPDYLPVTVLRWLKPEPAQLEMYNIPLLCCLLSFLRIPD